MDSNGRSLRTAFQAELVAHGAPGGFSFSCAEPLAVIEATSEANGEIELAADASYWSDDDLMSAAEQLRGLGKVNVNRRYEFTYEPAAVVFLQLVLPVGLGVLSAAIYDALKSSSSTIARRSFTSASLVARTPSRRG